MTELESAVRGVRLVHLVMVASVPLYGLMAQVVKLEMSEVPQAVLYLFVAMAAGNLVLAAMLRRQMVDSAEEALQRDAQDKAALVKWRSGNVVSFALCEAVALFGLALKLLRGSWAEAGPFLLVSLVVLLMWTPRPPFVRD